MADRAIPVMPKTGTYTADFIQEVYNGDCAARNARASVYSRAGKALPMMGGPQPLPLGARRPLPSGAQ